jgi:DNA replication protein DnaC
LNGKEMFAPICPKCADEQLKKNEEQKKAQQTQEEARARRSFIESALQRASIPLRFQSHSFETFLTKSPEQEKNKKIAMDYAAKFPEILKKGTSMIFCGTTGTGKTHLACSIANEIIKDHACTALFISTIDAVRRVKETYRKNSEETEREAIAWFSRFNLLILDEVGVQFGSDTERMILFEIINKRYENMLPTIFLSNLSIANLKDFVGDRIIDRMKENGGRQLNFVWESNRNNN